MCGMFAARPPREVSLYRLLMSSPVCLMLSMQTSRLTRWLPSPRSARLAADTALIAPRPLRSMQGTWERLGW